MYNVNCFTCDFPNITVYLKYNSLHNYKFVIEIPFLQYCLHGENTAPSPNIFFSRKKYATTEFVFCKNYVFLINIHTLYVSTILIL